MTITRAEKAVKLFKEGYSCSQAVTAAFADLLPVDSQKAIAAAAPFGGGMGRMREVCGAVSGMLLVLGFLEGPTNPSDPQAKGACYKKVQQLAQKFRNENGSVICRELLGLPRTGQNPQPEARTEAYYKARPCAELVGCAAAILEEYLSENNK